MERCIRLSYRYHDTDIVELNAFAWTGTFGGTTRLYISHGELANAANTLTAFPSNVKDVREVTFGAFGHDAGGGAVSLKLTCIDHAGHCDLQMTLESDPLLRESPLDRVELCSAVEPASLDRFVEQMRILDKSLTGSAVLQFA